MAGIEREIGADAVIYLDQEGLTDAIIEAGTKAKKEDFTQPCMACLNEEYPTDVDAAGEAFGEARKKDKQEINREVL